MGLTLKTPTGERLEEAIRLGFLESNNETEHEAILVRIDLAIFMFVEKIIIQSDS